MYSADYVKQRIDTVRERMERLTYFYTNERSACPICVTISGAYDPINDVSFRVTCSGCLGAYWNLTPTANEVYGRVHWTDDEAVTATPGGKYYLGDAYIAINISDLALAERCQSFDGRVSVDDKYMTISRIDPLGALGTNRYKVILKSEGSR